MKPLPALVLFVAGLVTGTALTWVALRPPGDAPADAATSVAVPVDAGARDGGDVRVQRASVGKVEVARAEIVDHDAWARQGFVEMVPPVRLPSDGEGRDKIEVWLRVPDDGVITARTLDDGRRTIRFPPGTIADRVESWGYARADDDGPWRYSVTDVRGTRLAADGDEMFHVFVPTGPEPLARLVGWEWHRGNDLEQEAATSFLVSHLETLRTIQDRGRPQSAAERRALIESYRKNNDCASCHAHNKPVEVQSARGIHRGTDDNGWFVPLTVLLDTVPLETHRARDMNAGDPYLTFSCPQGEPPLLAEGAAGAREWRCLEGGSPSATLDVARALDAGDPRTLALCKSRAYLRAHMDDAARALFADAFAACRLPSG